MSKAAFSVGQRVEIISCPDSRSADEARGVIREDDGSAYLNFLVLRDDGKHEWCDASELCSPEEAPTKTDRDRVVEWAVKTYTEAQDHQVLLAIDDLLDLFGFKIEEQTTYVAVPK